MTAIRAWVRLDQALRAYDRELRRDYSVTGQQLAMMRIVEEMEPVTIAELRVRLVLHPATLGQLLERLTDKGLLQSVVDERDRRRRVITVTPRGRRLVAEAPLAGPVRLRKIRAPRDRLDRVAEAFEDAVDLFGLRRWV